MTRPIYYCPGDHDEPEPMDGRRTHCVTCAIERAKELRIYLAGSALFKADQRELHRKATIEKLRGQRPGWSQQQLVNRACTELERARQVDGEISGIKGAELTWQKMFRQAGG